LQALSLQTTTRAHDLAPFRRQRCGQDGVVSLSAPDLVSQRSMLVILIAACSTARTAFEAADNAIDAELCADLNRMIERSQAELEKLNRAIDESSRKAGER